MIRRTLATGSVAALFLVLGMGRVSALAQEPTDRNRATIRVIGEATVMVKPDQAEINIGVVTQSSTAQAAATQNAQKQDAVIGELKKMLGAGADIKTISYSLNPDFKYPREGGQPTISGYTASNVVQVKTSDLTQVGRIIDLATASGANTIQSLRFTLKDETATRAQALREASRKARSKAEAIASALGLKLVRILHLDEGSQMAPIPINGRVFGESVAVASTPVEPGTIDVRASVTLTMEVAP